MKVTDEVKVVAGVDVGKASLDVSVSAGTARRFVNTPEGIGELLGSLRSLGVTLVVCESTGGYERALVRALREAKMSTHVANPVKVRYFARAAGREAKTDQLDAQMLSRFGEMFDPDATEPQSAEIEELRDLLSRRNQLIDQRTQENNRLDKGASKTTRASTERHIQWLDGEIARLEREYRKVVAKSAELTESVALFSSVPGVGELTAATLAAYLPELGRYGGSQLASLVGLAPWAKDSGRQHGYRSIRGGRGKVRRVLYLAAMSAIRWNSDLEVFYRRLRQQGKPGKVALAAVARKLLLLLNAVARRGTPWEARTPATHHSPA